jgi:DNA-binding transcriptional LysR family regulator
MMIERPSLPALAVFVAVVQRGTMTAAAEADGISQPAISTQVKALERYYGTALLDPASGSGADKGRTGVPGRPSPPGR